MALISRHTTRRDLGGKRVTGTLAEMRAQVHPGQKLSALVVFYKLGPKFVDLTDLDQKFIDDRRDYVLGFYVSASESFDRDMPMQAADNCVVRTFHSPNFYKNLVTDRN